MSAGTMVADGNNGIDIRFHHGPDRVHHPLLHFGIERWDGVELDGIAVLAGSHGRYRAAAHADPVVIASQQHDRIAGLQVLFLAGLSLCRTRCRPASMITLVEAVLFVVLDVLKVSDTAADERLSELISL